MISPSQLTPGAHDAAVAAGSPMFRMLGSLWGMFSPKRTRSEDDLATAPERLASLVKPICTDMLKGLRYPGVPQIKEESVEALLQYMYKRAVEIGYPLDTPISAKAFRLGHSLGLVNYLPRPSHYLTASHRRIVYPLPRKTSQLLTRRQLCHPNHPTEVQGYVGLFTWLVVQYDDIVGQNDEMAEAQLFQERFFKGEKQPNAMLEGLASLMREAPRWFDPVMANLLQISTLKFLTCNLLERHKGFMNMNITRAGVKFPDFVRDLSGINVAFAVFCFPKAQYPDVEQYLEAIPDMARFIDISNDVLSFYKEELSGDTRNYVHNRAMATGRPVLVELEVIKNEVVEAANRAAVILEGRGQYEQSMHDSVRGLLAMHTANPRYKLKDLGLAEKHPLAPFEDQIGELFERMRE
ncbi:longiborneol synthase [Colletotrichum graminicola]|uniref:Longiborneol synthase n=1 Tax=Colletotrichum graminicola (strain M1.001 / M2 / FGSC 10212) TaxID=645133 RepID=E3QAC9_COLGM|nr:longiborneol synthase [Colletotrichum graminicola M1.001]EFQ27817.1 longiborneol synthase [Colletotrichum graminicola M1.001]WDK11476.1 longiborneol synthase [Colletotrichum graminicola]